MPRRTIAAVLFALCAACEIGTSWDGPQPHEVPAAVLLVRQPPARAAASAFLLQSILGAPSSPADGSDARPFETLRAALALAPSGALLRVEEGIWREKLEITRPVVLMGRGVGHTRIVAPDGAEIVIDVHDADHVQLYGLSVEGGPVGVRFRGGAGHRLENVDLQGFTESALQGRGAEIAVSSSAVRDLALGKGVRGLDIEGGSLEARRLTLTDAGRRGIVITGARARLEDLDATGTGLSAVQALDHADVLVLRGQFEVQSGSIIYAGASRLSVEGAHLRRGEYGVIAARGAELTVTDDDIADYRVAGVALVNAHGTIARNLIARGGTEAAISITGADGKTPVLLLDNRLQSPGNMGVHITGSSVSARGNTITGSFPDPQKEMGDAFYALDSTLVVEDSVMRGNSGSGITSLRSTVQLTGNSFLDNGRSGVLMLDQSKGTVRGNFFLRNARAAVEVGEQARVRLVKNRFDANPRLDIDTGCGRGLSGFADLDASNTFSTPVRRRVCVE